MAVFSFWHQGITHAPGMIQRLQWIWQKTHGTDEVKLIAAPESDDLIADEGIDPARLSMQIRSDILRLLLLAKHGGVWVDATLLPSTHLNTWLPGALGASGFFAFYNEHRDRAISSWFLAAQQGDPLIARWRDAFVEYFRTPRQLNKTAPLWTRAAQELRRAINPASFADPSVAGRSSYYPYFILHYHFDKLVRTDPVCAAIWQQTTKLSGSDAGRLKSACVAANGDLDDETMASLFQASPVHKLNWRKPEKFEKLLNFVEAGLSNRLETP
ncbi:hypothetical protein BMI90_02325 [Thioclava sp. L04-15]|uniref:capsular polysaccharide synthesis protein n=1 Tax=Thioclava sp. L04-15 TaxID=1915318 RepID=UPI00099896EE|nr:capsular polysaccharide synthesis protein [Thioclava sp. L04-15]OOY29122.1 hypothetical protein BMI90_02325 [Thioclava sp. L04-15]TNE87836.1 MAG: hypothetical protein EP337_10440 [Paracoccaceae bacterium]